MGVRFRWRGRQDHWEEGHGIIRLADGWIFCTDIKVTQHGDKNNAEEKDNKPGMEEGWSWDVR